MQTLTYRQARLIVVGFGTALVAGVALAAFYRGADLVEVGAIGLFLPVLVAFAYGGTRGGVVAGALAAGVYLVVRYVTLDLIGLGFGEFVGSAVARVVLYVGVGLLGGWANELLERQLRKLELYDEVDDDTGVGNARALLVIADREASRAQRYGTVFSVAVLDVDRDLFEHLPSRRSRRALRELCQTLDGQVRTTDLVTRVPLDDREELVVVLPETGQEGARVFLERLVPGARDVLSSSGVSVDGELTGTAFTLPGDEGRLRELQTRAREVLDDTSLSVGEAG